MPDFDRDFLLAQIQRALAEAFPDDWSEYMAALEALLNAPRAERVDPELSQREALHLLQAVYERRVNGHVQNIVDALNTFEITAGDGTELDEWIDNESEVIYTADAQVAVISSNNSGAYVDELGTDGIVDNGNIAWERLAYMALRADIRQGLDNRGVDMNNPGPVGYENLPPTPMLVAWSIHESNDVDFDEAIDEVEARMDIFNGLVAQGRTITEIAADISDAMVADESEEEDE